MDATFGNNRAFTRDSGRDVSSLPELLNRNLLMLPESIANVNALTVSKAGSGLGLEPVAWNMQRACQHASDTSGTYL